MNRYKYLRLDINPYLDDNGEAVGGINSFYAIHETEGKKLTPAKIKKDYYQNLEMIVHEQQVTGISNLFTTGHETYSGKKISFNLTEVREGTTLAHGYTEAKDDGTFREVIHLDSDYDYFICHPSWRTTEFDLYFSRSGKSMHLHMESTTQRMSRYLFAFAISTTTDFLSTDPENSISIEEVN